MLQLSSAGFSQVQLKFNGVTDKWEVWNNTTKLGESSVTCAVAETWYYIEFTVTINASGSYNLYIDDTLVSSETGVDTNETTGTDVDEVWFHGPDSVNEGEHYLDDIYIRDDATRHGANTRVVALAPDGAGNSSGFTPSAGSNYENLDETSPDDATSYNASTSSGSIDLVTLGDLPAQVTTVYGVEVQTVSTRDVQLPTELAHVVRTNATNYEGAAIAMADVWKRDITLWENNPNTAAAWTPTQVNGLEAGYKHES
jgi:hypothetical protein